MIPDNRPGAGGMIGTDMAAKATADGYTLLAASSGPVTINPLLQKVPFDPVRDLAPVANVGLSPYILVTGAKFPAANIKEFVALVKANPGKYSFASSGTGATAHLVAEIFNGRAGLQVTHVPYKGSAPALIDVISGEIAYALETMAATMPHIKSGRLRAYGISTVEGQRARARHRASRNGRQFAGLRRRRMDRRDGARRHAEADRSNALPVAVDKAMQAQDTRERIEAAGLEVDYRRTRGLRAVSAGTARALCRDHQEEQHQDRLSGSGAGDAITRRTNGSRTKTAVRRSARQLRLSHARVRRSAAISV